MTAEIRIFITAIFSDNPVFVMPLGALLALMLAGKSGGAGMRAAARVGLILMATGLLGGSMVAHSPAALHPLLLAGIACAGIGMLYASGELRGEWLGLPKALTALIPFVAFPLIVARHVQWSMQSAMAAGLGLGFAGACILLAAAQAAITLSESARYFKTLPVLLFVMGIVAMVLYGFALL